MNLAIKRGMNPFPPSEFEFSESIGYASEPKLAGILLLEDYPAILSLMEQAVVMSGYMPAPARSVEEARSLIGNGDILAHWRAAFLDIELEDGNGLEVYHIIRSFSADFPVIMMSAGAFGGLLAPYLMRDDHLSFLAKPFSLSTFQILIEQPRLWGGDVSRLVGVDSYLT